MQREVLIASSDRMLREGVDAIEALAAQTPFVLVLEDLHWSDPFTLNLLSALVQRREPAKFLVVGSYCPVEVWMCSPPVHSLLQDLLAQTLCVEPPLRLLSPEDIEEYLEVRYSEQGTLASKGFPHLTNPSPTNWKTLSCSALAHVLYQRTEGNPLFLKALLGENEKHVQLIAKDIAKENEEIAILRKRSTPQNIRRVIERQIGSLTAQEQHMLEVASVMGREFTVAAVAAVLQISLEVAEDCCAHLAHRHLFVQEAGTTELWDGAVTTRYTFVHTLAQEVWSQRITRRQQVVFRARLAEWEHVAYGHQLHQSPHTLTTPSTPALEGSRGDGAPKLATAPGQVGL